MNTLTDYQKRMEERQLIKKETKTTVIISVSLMIFTLVLALISYYGKFKQTMVTSELEELRNIISVVVVVVMVAILGLRRSIYYSRRLIREDFSLTQVLQKWRRIDIIMLSVASLIPVCGLVLAILGLSFDLNFHFFLGTAILMVILMPVGIKVRSKLSILRQQFPDI